MPLNPVMFLKIQEASNMKETIDFACKNGYHGIMTPIINPLFKREFIKDELAEQHINFTRSPLILTSPEWSQFCTPVLNPPNLQVADKELARANELQFSQELQFAFHIKYAGSILIKLTNHDPASLGKFVKRFLKETHDAKIIVELEMLDPATFSSVHRNDIEDDQPGEDQWLIWHKFHEATGYSSKVELALVLTDNVPPKEELKRWLGESIAMLIIPHTCFMSNSHYYPVLPKIHSDIVVKFMQYTKCQIAIVPRGSLRDNRIKSYGEFINYISKRLQVNDNSGFEDLLRFPLQPLHDNLDSSTYETFERDPAKYVAYQKAIERALFDMVPVAGGRTIVLIIVGAGRGPLIRAAVNASKNTGRKLKILVVEKNPNAIVTLSSLIKVMWKREDITLISKDMRNVELKEKGDILVSELLGSLGDNELSPECLDGAQRLLKPSGISIPCNSVAYIRPVMTNQNYSSIRDLKNTERPKKMYESSAEVNWLAYLSSVYYIDKPKELWTFEHPNNDEVIDNSRYKNVDFTAKLDCVLHGFSGYFTSQLYKEIEISILPSSHTQGMGSWYSMFLPIINPVLLKKGESFSIEIWRKCGDIKVWYEWEVHHPDGTISERMNKDGWCHPIYLWTDMDNLRIEE